MLVSVASDGSLANAASGQPVIDAVGRFVAFDSTGTNLVASDTNGRTDIFIHDTQSRTTERVALGVGGAEPNGHSYRPRISADGRFIAFMSDATNLVPDDTNGVRDIFVHDRLLNETRRASVDSNGTEANALTGNPSAKTYDISADGRFVAFDSFASNLVDNDTNNVQDVFVFDRENQTTERVSIRSDGGQAAGVNHSSFSPSISANGQFVAFASGANNLVPGDTNNNTDVFVYD